MTRIRANILAFFLLASPFIYSVFVYSSVNFFNINNFVIYILSACICFYSFWDIKNYGVKPHSLFLFVFFIFLFWNTSNLVGIQLEKTPKDVYYYFFGPLIFATILWLAFHLKVPNLADISKFKIDPNLMSFILLVLFILIKLYIGSKVGYRIESVDAGYLESGEKYSLPGFTGVSTVLQWTLVMLIPHIKKTYIVLILVSIIAFAFLHVKRGDIARVFVFLITYFFVVKIKEKEYFSLKKTIIIAIVFLLFSIVFAEFGEWRRSNQIAESIIQQLLESRSDSIVLNWIYSYTTIPYDILKIFDELNHPYYPYGLVSEFVDPQSYEFKDYMIQEEKANISGNNAGTFLSMFVHDFGVFYFIEVIFFGIGIAVLIILTRMFNFFGIYCMVLTMLVFSFFGNYLTSSGLIFSFLFSIILFNFVKINDKLALRFKKGS